eukprot:TRINITY_DN26760_c1_g2_i1.p1 TRINITY_DN26760_c1_g2~~TRINITY_DN26760_c1_g2_i1.p1  ORF type:complete len:768 (+),score=106.40 TRINITY_DN26760_c1_g2_i1:142-2445(+)
MGTFDLTEIQVKRRLEFIGGLVAQPIPELDPEPSLIGERLYVGNRFHAANVKQLVSLGVNAVLNCAPTGVGTLDLHEYDKKGISYSFTNVAQDNFDYPILHDRDGLRSEHLDVALEFYDKVCSNEGKALFFCVAGQNRSATLAVAVLMLRGHSLASVLDVCSKRRPFILENVGFQRQLIEMEAIEDKLESKKRPLVRTCPHQLPLHPKRLRAEHCSDRDHIEVELLVPGLCTFDIVIPIEATIETVRRILLERVNSHLSLERSLVIGKSWLVFTMFGLGPEFDVVLEEAAVEVNVQVARLEHDFGLSVIGEERSAASMIRWDAKCRFEVVIFSLQRPGSQQHEPFTFRHEERPGAPGTLLAESFMDTYLRAWDFGSGEAYRSTHPIVFSFAQDPRMKRDFMNVSTSTGSKMQKFGDPGEGAILGMGNNAIVHRVKLEAAARCQESRTSSDQMQRLCSETANEEQYWDAAVKRPFSLWKMLGAVDQKSEAGVAKRLRMAGALNKQGRLLYFYGLGISLASNSNNHDEYKFEITLLSQYQEDFSSYTLKSFMDDYTTSIDRSCIESIEHKRLQKLQSQFTLIKVKVLLVSLLNGFRDLTLMGVQAFDFNHLNNVLISRDYRKARLIDIDGNSKGSIQYPSEYIHGRDKCDKNEGLHKPALDVDLSVLLPVVVQQLIFGKGRGKPFVSEQVSRVKRAKSEDDAKAIIRTIVRENFFPQLNSEPNDGSARLWKHLQKVVEWFYAMLMKKSPWTTWTNDIYDAMRCIDHLPI